MLMQLRSLARLVVHEESFTPTGSFSTVGTMTVPLQLASGTNTIEFADPSAYTPDFDRIIVAGHPN
jgi:hypothetical protein